MNMAIGDFEFTECERKESIENVVVITTKVDDLDTFLVDFLQDEANETGVLVRPSIAAPAKRPTVNDVAIENDLGGVGVFEEVVDLVDLAIGRSQMHI